MLAMTSLTDTVQLMILSRYTSASLMLHLGLLVLTLRFLQCTELIDMSAVVN